MYFWIGLFFHLIKLKLSYIYLYIHFQFIFYKEEIYHKHMINIYRSPKLNEKVENCNPGPGAYQDTQNHHNNKTTSSFFASKMKRSLQFLQQNNTVGPGQYFKADAQKSFTKQIKCKTNNVCALKSSREDILKQQLKTLQFQKEVDEIMRKDRNSNENKGKIIGMKQKKQLKQKTNQQTLPSIPTNQNSFGYKYDPQCNKLINNINPKILFADHLKVGGQKDFYFQRIRAQQKSKGIILNSSSKRFQSQRQQNINLPNPTSYSSDKYNTISQFIKNQSSKPLLNKSSKPHLTRSQTSKNIDMLKLNKLNRQFKQYIQKQKISIQQLQKMQKQDKLTTKNVLLHKKKDKLQDKLSFFLCKEQRFRTNHQNQVDMGQGSSQNNRLSFTNYQEIGYNCNKKQLFKLGSQRFKEKDKQVLGPGSYNVPSTKDTRGVLLNHYQKRFADKMQQNTPGPGRYSPKEQSIQLKKQIHQKSNKDYQALIHPLQKQKPMSSLYQQVGKQMNYFQKVFKLSNKIQTKQNKKMSRSPKKTDLRHSAKRQIQKVLQANNTPKILNRQQQELKQNMPNKTVNFKHLYQYNNIPKWPNDLGPGHYQLRSSFDKKTFNKTIEINR